MTRDGDRNRDRRDRSKGKAKRPSGDSRNDGTDGLPDGFSGQLPDELADELSRGIPDEWLDDRSSDRKKKSGHGPQAQRNSGPRSPDEWRRAVVQARLRWLIYWLLIVASVAVMTGRLLQVTDPHGATPFLSANDRSRWAAVRALGDDGAFEIDAIIREVHEPSGRRPWSTIDRVRHHGVDGREHDYSSKPPLFTMLLAAEYRLIRQATGWKIAEQPYLVSRLMLWLTQIAPLAVGWLVMARMVERHGQTDWGRLFTMTAAVFGTFLTTFAVTLNNHLPAALCVLFAVSIAWPLLDGASRAWWRFVAAGLLAAATVTFELPGLSFAALLGFALLLRAPLRTLIGFVPAAAIIAAAFLYTNWLGHGSLRPPYTHRSDGPIVATLGQNDGQPDGALVDTLTEVMDRGETPDELRAAIANLGVELSSRTTVTRSAWRTDAAAPPRWIVWDIDGQDRFAVVREPTGIAIRQWDNWYDYPGSYWADDRREGVDRGEPSRSAYALHVTLGHHGLWSLTPIWLLSLFGAAAWLVRSPLQTKRPSPGKGSTTRKSEPKRTDDATHVGDSRGEVVSSSASTVRFSLPSAATQIAATTLLLTLVCLAFYISRPQIDRNYGGVSCGLRWTFWLIPLWLVCLIPAADKIAFHTWLRRGAVVLLAVSVFSAAYATLNPWQHPWLYEAFLRFGIGP